MTSQIAGAVVASGRIEVDRNRQIVQHETGGVVADILVDEGDSAPPGTPLRLDAEQLTSQLAIVEGQLYEFMARRGRLEAQRDEVETVTLTKSCYQPKTNSTCRNWWTGSATFDARRVSNRKSRSNWANAGADQRANPRGRCVGGRAFAAAGADRRGAGQPTIAAGPGPDAGLRV